MPNILVIEANIEAGARALTPACFDYMDRWSNRRIHGTLMKGSGEKDSLAAMEVARGQARAVLEAVQARDIAIARSLDILDSAAEALKLDSGDHEGIMAALWSLIADHKFLATEREARHAKA